MSNQDAGHPTGELCLYEAESEIRAGRIVGEDPLTLHGPRGPEQVPDGAIIEPGDPRLGDVEYINIKAEFIDRGDLCGPVTVARRGASRVRRFSADSMPAAPPLWVSYEAALALSERYGVEIIDS